MLVYSQSLEEHLLHLQCVLHLLRTHQLFANKEKYQFGQIKLEYLGHVISTQGVEADTNKIATIQNLPSPKFVKELQGFLGLTGYYCRFIRRYGDIARPLTNQLKKDCFHWTAEA